MKDYSESSTPKRSIACFGLPFRGLLRELAYDIALSGILYPFEGINKFNPTQDEFEKPPHIFYKLFGCRGLSGKLRITDGTFLSSKQYKGKNDSEPIEIRSSTSLSYKLHANRSQSLFTYEVAMIDQINYKIIGYNLNQSEKIFLLATLMRLPGYSLAGNGSTGSGIIWKVAGFEDFKNEYLPKLKKKLKTAN